MAVNIIEGKVINEGMKVGIVCARFNEFITSMKYTVVNCSHS